MRCLVLAFVLGIVAVAAVAGVAHADDREDARREFAAGQEADRLGRYDEAIEHYETANRLLPHPNTIYNIAVDFEHLGRLREATEWYHRYLDAAVDSQDRDKVQRHLAELAGHAASLSVRSTPEGALVTIDGVRTGVTPLYSKLAGGPHHVEVDYEGQRATRDVELELGEPADLMFPFGGEVGTLSVGGAPAGAYVSIDNITVGVVPSTTQISPGDHKVRVTAAGYAPFEIVAIVTPNADAHIDAQLARNGGEIASDNGVAPNPNDNKTVALLFGAIGGLEAQSAAGEAFAMVGTRLLHYDLMFRIGRAHGGLGLEFVLRWNFLEERFTPFLAAGYGYTNGNYGYIVNAGLRYDLSRSDHSAFSLVLDGGLRYIVASSDDSTGAMTTSELVYPIELGIEGLFK